MEFFNATALRRREMPEFGDDPYAQLGQILQHGLTENGIYGLKIFAWQFDRAAAANWANVLPGLTFVYVSREDILGQAVSYVRAQQTNQWRSTHPASGRAMYDESFIARTLEQLVLDETRWRTYFARNGLTPLKLTYEELTRAPQEAVARIASRLGLEHEPLIDETKFSLEIQRDDETVAWRKRFLQSRGDRRYLDRPQTDR